MSEQQAELVLDPDDAQAAALRAYARRYAEAVNWVIDRLREDGGGDQVLLHHRYYGGLRERFGLPSQSVVLCLKHSTKLVRPTAQPLTEAGPIPYDRHLFSLKTVDRVSLATLDGRVVVPCALASYVERAMAVGDGELQFENGRWLFRVKTSLPKHTLEQARNGKETKMSDKLLGRIARLVAGAAHSAVAQAEQMAPVSALEQAIREIDQAEQDVKTEIGKSEATRFNLTRKKAQLGDEHAALLAKIETALAEGVEPLAESGVARQIDIENQVILLDRGLADVEQDLAKLAESISALQASRREAKERLRDLKAAELATAGESGLVGGPGGRGTSGKAAEAIAAAARLAEDLTGVPGAGVPKNQKDLDELAELHRKREIRERLAQIKAKGRDKG